MNLRDRLLQLKTKQESTSATEIVEQKPEKETAPQTPTPEISVFEEATPLGELRFKLNELQEAMLSEHPKMPTLLQQIHKTMLEQGDLVVQLSDEEIGIMISGLKKHMNVTVVAEKTKKASSSAALKKASKAELIGGGAIDLSALAAQLGVKM